MNELFEWYCSEFNLYPLTKSKFQNRLKLLNCLFKTNSTVDEMTFRCLVKEYHDHNTPRARQLDIRYGEGSGTAFSNLLKDKAKNKISFGKIEFWLNKGLTLEEAQKQKREHYAELNKKGTAASLLALSENLDKKRKKYQNVSQTKQKRKNLDYWIQQGYSINEAINQIKKYIPPSHTLESFIERHGEELGNEKYQKCYKKQRDTKIAKYGSVVISGYVSKASIKYFKPLYKILRKNGIYKEDVIWGIGNKREFTTFDKKTNKNYAFDFVVKSKKIIIEYNDPFWHARNKKEWKNPMVKYEDSYKRDKNKKNAAFKMGFDIIYVWSDNLPDINYLKNLILK